MATQRQYLIRTANGYKHTYT